MQILGLTLLAGGTSAFPSAQAASPVPGEEHCVVNVASDDVLNLRDGPATSADVLTGKKYGTCGIIVTDACKGSWCPVDDGHFQGWVSGRFIAMVSPARYCVTGVVPGDTLNLRAYPSAQSRVVHRLGRNQCSIAFLPYATGAWRKIRVEGWEGWVNGRYLSGQ
jgi:SH3-like domain-containing protein